MTLIIKIIFLSLNESMNQLIVSVLNNNRYIQVRVVMLVHLLVMGRGGSVDGGLAAADTLL